MRRGQTSTVMWRAVLVTIMWIDEFVKSDAGFRVKRNVSHIIESAMMSWFCLRSYKGTNPRLRFSLRWWPTEIVSK